MFEESLGKRKSTGREGIMHYLHSAPDIEVIEEVISWVGQKVHETIVLVDGSMLNDDERAIFELAGFSRLWQRGHIFSDIEELGPLFIRAEHLSLDNFEWLRDILKNYAAELPFISFIRINNNTPNKWPDILTWIANVHTEEGLALLLRYFDTRALSIIFNPQNKFFTASQEAAIAGAIEKFAWINRFGKFCSYAPADSNQAVTALILNDHQLEMLYSQSLPDQIWAEIQKNNPGNSTVSAAIYSRIFELLENKDVIQGSFTALVQFIRESIKDV